MRNRTHVQGLVAHGGADRPAGLLAAPAQFSLVCFRYRADNGTNERLLAAVNASGKAFLSHTVLNGQYVLRFAIGNFLTTEEDVRETWALIQENAAALSSAGLAVAARG